MMTNRDYYRQRRIDQARTCITCGVSLPPQRRGLFCEAHGRDQPAPNQIQIQLLPCEDCGRPLRGNRAAGRTICLSCLGGQVA